MVPLDGVEPSCLAAHDFESCVSANSTTAASPTQDICQIVPNLAAQVKSVSGPAQAIIKPVKAPMTRPAAISDGKW